MSPRHTRYDMIFLGGGCAALSLLVRLVQSGQFAGLRFLVVDPDRKTANDRTWCFWEKGSGYFEKVVYRQWEQLDFYSSDFSAPLSLDGYRYKMIRGVDFYAHCLDVLERSGQVEWVSATVTAVTRFADQVVLQVDTNPSTSLTWNLTAPLVFNSIYKPAVTSSGQVDLLQHFKGWVIETSGSEFHSQRATLMDFRVSQQEGTTFVYVMPFSERRALVEYTLFTKSLLTPAAYEQGLRAYIQEQLGIKEYQVTEEEFGVIPMTTRSFSFYNDGIFNLGTAGGQTKASSGYTFQFIQKQSDRIVRQLIQASSGGLQQLKGNPARFHFYDQVLLQVLAKGYWPGDRVFARLFERNKASSIFRFLDNETSWPEELAIISSLPTWPFLRGAAATI
jgi:lycopene beta-cyclase